MIGDDNEFEVGCCKDGLVITNECGTLTTKAIFISDVEGTHIGNNNTVEARGRILGSTTVGNFCVIGSGCSTENNETISDFTVIYGSQSKRRTQSEPLVVNSVDIYWFQCLLMRI